MPINVVLPHQDDLRPSGVEGGTYGIGTLDEELSLVTSDRSAVELGKRNNPR